MCAEASRQAQQDAWVTDRRTLLLLSPIMWKNTSLWQRLPKKVMKNSSLLPCFSSQNAENILRENLLWNFISKTRITSHKITWKKKRAIYGFNFAAFAVLDGGLKSHESRVLQVPPLSKSSISDVISIKSTTRNTENESLALSTHSCSCNILVPNKRTRHTRRYMCFSPELATVPRLDVSPTRAIRHFSFSHIEKIVNSRVYFTERPKKTYSFLPSAEHVPLSPPPTPFF